MRTSRFSEEQIIGVLKEADSGLAVGEVCRKHGICDQTYYRWKAKYGGLEVSEAVRRRESATEARDRRGLPQVLVMDNGPEFAGQGLDVWDHGRRAED